MRINHIVWDPATRELSYQAGHRARPARDLRAGRHDRRARSLPVTAIGVADAFRRCRQVTSPGTTDPLLPPRARCTAEWARAAGPRQQRRRQRPRSACSRRRQRRTSSSGCPLCNPRPRPAPTINFNVGPRGKRAVFADATISTLTQELRSQLSGALTAQWRINLAAQWRGIVAGAVGTVAFGTYRPLDFTEGVSRATSRRFRPALAY